MTRAPRLARWQRLAAASGSALLVLALGATTALGLRQARAHRQWVDHTHQVIETLDVALRRLVDAETGQRGYLLTGEESYLTPYHNAEADVGRALGTLRRLTADNPRQQARLDTLDRLVRARFVVLDDRITIRRAHGLDAAANSLRLATGRALMDGARRIVSDMQAEEQHLLRVRGAVIGRHEREVLSIVLGGTVAATLVALLLNGLLTRYALAQGAAVERVTAQAAALEDQNEQLQAQMLELEMQAAQLEEQAAELEVQTEELRATAEELEAQRAAAESANAAKSQFLATMSHELRTPLNAIRGYVELLSLGLYGAVDDRQREILARIRRNEQVLLSLVTDILNFAKLEAGRVELCPVDVPVADVPRQRARVRGSAVWRA
jgi:two-component system, sensor histidine kinase and response regulator